MIHCPIKKILVIRLSALGDIIQTFPAFQAIRQHHPDAHITIMTTAPYVELMKASNLFDDVLIYRRMKVYEIKELLDFRQQFLKSDFDRVYDLQMSQRTNFIFRMIGGRKSGSEWVGSATKGTVRFCEPKIRINTFNRHQALLAVFGIRLEKQDLRYVGSPLKINLPSKYAVIVPGASNTFNGAKKWPQSHYAALCQYLVTHTITPVIIGGPGEDNRLIQEICPQAINLTGQTSFPELITISKNACIAVGNDTGPMHLASASLAPVLILFSGKTDPTFALTPEPHINWLQAENLADLEPNTVIKKVEALLNLS
ncbi:glycosyltransferase family 9 protein [Candidatus Odyssella acanthamoebae]|uniref:glycosyltransferase family 9 protein n=1 Tax=Candidatus Odyssella acanthamoebae TaxID=91604 RepID=UPI00068FFAEB|nr:glycosyltransferase family 9 protein [Candidatus Paracaedibacter acanthamoebae]